MASDNNHTLEGVQIFNEVQAVLNLEIVEKLPNIGDVVKSHLQKGLKLEQQGGLHIMKGSLQQVTEFHSDVEQLLSKSNGENCNIPDVIVTGTTKPEVTDFIEQMLTNRDKTSESKKGNLVNKTYKLMPFCIMVSRYLAKLKPYMKDVRIFIKDINLPNVKVTFKSRKKEAIDELLQVIESKYKEDVPYIGKTIDEPSQYVSDLYLEIKANTKPKLMIVLNGKHVLMDMIDGGPSALEVLLKDFKDRWKDEHRHDSTVESKKARRINIETNKYDISPGSISTSGVTTTLPGVTTTIPGASAFPQGASAFPQGASAFSQGASASPPGALSSAKNGVDLRDKEQTMEYETYGSSTNHGSQHNDGPPIVKEELQVDSDTMEYIRRYCHEELHGLAAQYNVIIEDNQAEEGRLYVVPLTQSMGDKKQFAISVDKIGQYIQDLYYELVNDTIDVTHKNVEEKSRQIKRIAYTHKVWLSDERNNKLYVMGQTDGVSAAVEDIKLLLGLAPQHKKRERVLVKSETGHSNRSSTKTRRSSSDMEDMSKSLPDYHDDSAATGGAASLSLAIPKSYKHVLSSVTIHTSVSDITQLKVDAVVNAANAHLQHYGGVAWALSKAGGYKVDDESKEYVRKHGQLPIADTCLTTAGKMPAKKIIHTVGPQWNSYMAEKCLTQLNDTFTNVLKRANKERYKSVAIPAISSGVYGMPPSLVADIAVTSITEFLNKSSITSLCDIHLVDIDHGIIMDMQSELDKQVTAGKYTMVKATAVIDTYSKDTGKGARPKNSLGFKEHLHKDTPDTSKHINYADSVKKDGTSVDYPRGSSSTNLRDTQSNTAVAQVHQAGKTKSESQGKNRRKDAEQSDKDKPDDCCICMCPPDNPKTLPKCKHTFCSDCIDRGFKVKPVCPVCGEIYGDIIGDQPEDGTMNYTHESWTRLPGYEKYGAIMITYHIPSGTQGKDMPNPGQYYSGTSRRAYLPDNTEGNKVLKLLQRAFKARLIFTVGSSRTTGEQNTVTWNDIHHKTSPHGGPQSFGYPDPSYLSRVQEELAAKGIK